MRARSTSTIEAVPSAEEAMRAKRSLLPRSDRRRLTEHTVVDDIESLFDSWNELSFMIMLAQGK